jgi:membrane protein required for colicin V production
MEDLSTLDAAVLVVMGIAIVRGMWIGLIREGFSIAALGGGLLAVRYGIEPLANWVEKISNGDLGPTASAWIAGAAIAIVAIVALGSLGKVLRRGVHAVGLGWADRIAGGFIGAAEGALVAAVLLVVATWAAGPDSPLVENSKSIEILDGLQKYVVEHRDELPAVAAPADWLALPDLTQKEKPSD